MVRSSLRFIVPPKLVVDGSNNSVNLVCHDFGDVEQLSFSSRIASSHSFAVGLSATLLIRMEMLVLWHAFDAKLIQVFEDTVRMKSCLYAMRTNVFVVSEAVYIQCADK